jgi:flagellin-like protein
MVIKNSKKGQSEIITTVLLILISIAAVVLVSSFILNMVRDNLKGTECFQTTGQLELKMEDGFTFFNNTDKMLYLSIGRGIKDFNLSGIIVVYSNDRNSETKKIKAGTIDGNIYYYNNTGSWDNLTSISVPSQGQMRAYRLNSASLGVVNKATIYPILQGGQECENGDQKTIPII